MGHHKFLFNLIFFGLGGSLAAEELAEITILASRDRAISVSNPVQQVSALDLQESKVLTVNEALRKLPGVYARDEEGLGLRPNIGIRGLNPTRSSKVLLLEDGLPLSFAPYGDNASYFHPALERFERIELLKNSGQIAFGPQTIGGIVNYLSAATPETLQRRVSLRGGDKGLRAIDIEIGDTVHSSSTGWRLDATHKHSLGARKNIDLDVADLGLKIEQPLGNAQSLTVRVNGYRERSQVPYSGLTLAEYRDDPRANPFINDFFDVSRQAVSLVHGLQLSSATTLRTAVYHTRLQRDWWRQSSNSRQRPNDAGDPACRGMSDLSKSCGNEGRLRGYQTVGIEPRLQIEGETHGGTQWRALAGLRHHRELQHRLQLNGDTPRARNAGTGINGGWQEDNLREVRAQSGFIELTLRRGATAVTPGLRYEEIRYAREDRLRDSRGKNALHVFIPGVALSHELGDTLALFGGVHRGFAPPRVEDVIGSGGVATELDAELSWNRELGLRWRPNPASRVEIALFDMNFANQIIPASLAGGSGATLTNGGRTRHRGVELLAEWRGTELAEIFGESTSALTTLRPRARVATNWLRDAHFGAGRYAIDPAQGRVSIGGNRLPYAAQHVATLTLGADWSSGVSLQIEGHYVGSMYTDDLNTPNLSSDGQRGRLGGHASWNVNVNHRVNEQFEWFVGAKNLADRLYIADLSRGIIPGSPRQLQAGFDYRF